MQIQVRLSNLIAPAFIPIHKKIKAYEASEFWLKGGRGSTKSSFAAIEILLGIMSDPDANAIGFRKVGETLRTSILGNFEWAMEMLNVSHLFKVTTSPAEITYKPTGQKILLKGLDKALKVKSLKLKKGYFKFLWFEEAEEFNGMNEIRSVQQSVLRGGEKFIQFITYNPPNDPQAWVNKESLVAKPGRHVHHSTYQDVPREWLGEKFIEDAEWLRENNILAYEHEYLGIAVGLHESIIFSGKYSVQTFDPKPEWHGPYFGADWGFSQDPNTLVKCWVEEIPHVSGDDRKASRRLFIEYAAFEQGVELDDIPRFYDTVPDSKSHKIYADCSRPETISHIKHKGYNIVGAEKWPGSVEDGIAVLKSFVEIVIHTRCTEMQEEARLYSYKIDKLTKDITTDIVDKFNHGWDAVRYALSKYIKSRGKSILDILGKK